MAILELIILACCLIAAVVYHVRSRRAQNVVAFFHPYCNAGGGGERVLWCAIRTMQKRIKQDYKYIVFTGDQEASKEQILLKARQRFGIELDPNNIEFVYLRFRRLVEADLYPVFTLVAQALAGGLLALEAVLRVNPYVLIDSMGYPLALPVFKLIGGAKVAAYVHYPTISSDMLKDVQARNFSFNNSRIIVDSFWLTAAKIYYYRAFAFGYWLAGTCADCVMVNGRWTQSHMEDVWRRKDTHIVYPPCDVTNFLNVETVAEQILEETKTVRILSLGQIRPEKNHKLQVDVLAGAREPLKKLGYEVTLSIAGGCRNRDDEKRVNSIKKYAEEKGVSNLIEWHLNIPYEDLLGELSRALISIHTMHNEHFGISVVEGMAAGTIMVSNCSGGPQMDIIRDYKNHNVGYLAADEKEYVAEIVNAVKEGKSKRDTMRKYAKASVERFGEQAFEESWMKEIAKVVA